MHLLQCFYEKVETSRDNPSVSCIKVRIMFIIIKFDGRKLTGWFIITNDN